MKIRKLLALALALSAVVFIACSDDLTSIGSGIQPEGDDIFVASDTLQIEAGTYSFKDSVYARTTYGLLGEYIDPTFGKVKSDYMCEFYCPDGASFSDADKVASIDSVIFQTGFVNFVGDSISPMGLSVYEVTQSLKPFFFTSVDPKKYIGDNPKKLGQSIFSIYDLNIEKDTKGRTISTKLDISLGNRFYNEWLRNKETFKNSDNLKKFFKGVYVTTSFGSGSLINVEYSILRTHYTLNIRNAANTADSTRVFDIWVTPEVIQMNHVENTLPDFNKDRATKTYLKTPAGVYTELTIPLKNILDKAGEGRSINAANFKMKGFTEEEEKLGLSRPNYVLLINKDSLPNFFFNKKMHDNVTSFIISRNSGSNTYDFGNIASIINHYAKHYKGTTPPDLKYLIIPIKAEVVETSTSLSISRFENLMYPTSAILRTDPANMKMPIIFSQYNSHKK